MLEMGKSWKNFACKLGIATLRGSSISLLMSNCVFAQSVIIPDNNLGNESSQAIANYQNATDAIAGGAIRDRNLFHSFREFNVSEGRTAVFLSPNGNIQNILVRVTGNNRSEIFGKLGILDSNANLFFINPNGIFFGANAQLNIAGSFVASTASGIKFADDTVFSATNPQTAPLLTISTPVGLQFDKLGGEINHYGSLQVPTDKTLALVGGNVNLFGNGQLDPNRRTLKVIGGQIAIAGISAPGTIQINLDSQNQPLSFPDNITLADISLQNLAVILTDGLDGGFIQLQGRQIQLTQGSIAQAENLSSEDGRGIVVQAQQLTLEDGSQITASVGENITGSGGSLTVKVSDSIQVRGTIPPGKPFAGAPSGLVTRSFGDGSAGALTVETKKLIIDGGGNITTTAWRGKSNSGILTVTASDSIFLDGASFEDFPSGLFSQTLRLGNAGSITINTRQFIAKNGGVVTAGTGKDSQGKGSNLTVNASEFIDLSGVSPRDKDPSGLFARSRGTGEAGSLFVNTPKLILRDGARLTVEALKTGNAGTLAVNATEMRLERQSKVVAETVSGNGGDLRLEIQNLLLLRDRSQISTTAGTAGGGGNGGNITIDTPNGFIVTVPKENSDITANAFAGSGGRVQINAYDIFGIEQRSRIDLVTLLNTNDPTKLNPQLLQTNDITAISQTNPTLNGVVDINTPDVDPNSGLVNLPTQPINLKVDETCKVIVANNKSSFTIAGRGGIPSSPTETLSSDAVMADWIAVDSIRQPSSQPTANLDSPQSPSANIVEATGWVINPQGEVVLTANASTAETHSSWYKSSDCNIPH
ncbi:filamentous hemagglutinin N-terminal domain-containing protein [Calothrix sp. FACHB-1219]|nr:filamentous hemagglutinin N-terminal domain-containing protein [Calothrix sp. FACHB-168]MBD2215636.1 filamentous hemagglutinin N-terminal domain-containing protein [Calothrix sp. FACHB-1219]